MIVYGKPFPKGTWLKITFGSGEVVNDKVTFSARDSRGSRVFLDRGDFYLARGKRKRIWRARCRKRNLGIVAVQQRQKTCRPKGRR